MIDLKNKQLEGRLVKSLPTIKNPLGILYFVIRTQGSWVFLKPFYINKKDKRYVENKPLIEFNRSFELEHPEELSKFEENIYDKSLIYD